VLLESAGFDFFRLVRDERKWAAVASAAPRPELAAFLFFAM
jgi:hypothetical protein